MVQGFRGLGLWGFKGSGFFTGSGLIGLGDPRSQV